MKSGGSQRLLPKRWLSRQRLTSERGKLARDSILLALSAFSLSGFPLFGKEMPLAACLITAMPFGLRTLSAALGAIAGYAVFWGTDAAAMLALSALLFSASAVFQGTELPGRRWFYPVLSACVCALLGSISLFSGGSVSLWLIQVILAGLGAWLSRSALLSNRSAGAVLTAAMAAGLNSLFPQIPLGLGCAVAICVAGEDAAAAALLGLAIDLSAGAAPVVTAALMAPTLLCQALPRRDRLLTAATYLLLTNLTLLLFGQATLAGALCITAGAAAGCLCRKSAAGSLRLSAQNRESAAVLNNAAEVLELLCRRLPKTVTPASASEAESVYDGAAERVCRCCARFHRCWEHHAGETYRALTGAARRMIEKGVVEAADFPSEFRENCCHVEGFATAVNQELEGMLYRRRYRMELSESRQAVAEELESLAAYLRSAATRRPKGTEVSFRPVVGLCSMGRNGARVNGDRGACFAGPVLDYFVLLCDGMGTGEEASLCSAETVRLLERLLRSGLAPEQALRILNSMELLSGDEAFTTVDLLHIHLQNGRAELYKWGSAASYWRGGEKVKKIGTDTTPPGAGVGGEHAPECYELSLKRGEMLVLATDGADGEETEAAIAAFRGQSPQELAALLISGQPAQDDMTAVVISLQPC